MIIYLNDILAIFSTEVEDKLIRKKLVTPLDIDIVRKKYVLILSH